MTRTEIDEQDFNNENGETTMEMKMDEITIADHVSKVELREWCEANCWNDFVCPEIKLLNMTKLLAKFCGEE